MDWQQRITIEPGKRSGKACIRGMRLAVADILSYLAAGESEDTILEAWPQPERDEIRAALACAADRERHTKLLAGH